MAIIEKLTAIAEAIRSKTNTTEKMTLDEMPSAIEGIQSGGEDFSRYAWTISLLPSEFATEKIILNLDNANTLASLWYANNPTQANQCVKYIEVNCPRKVVSLQHAFSSAYNKDKLLERITLNVDTSASNAFIRVFGYLSSLKIIDGTPLNFSSATSVTNCFQECYALEEVRLAEGTLAKTITFSWCSLLSDASIQSIIDGLATVETAQTLTLHATVKAKLTEEQIAQITAKNWTLA